MILPTLETLEDVCCTVARDSEPPHPPSDVNSNGHVRTIADLTDEELLQIFPGSTIEPIEGTA